MTKIAINTCFGGFGLSDDAFVALMKRKGIDVYPDRQNSLSTRFWKTPIDQQPPILRMESYQVKEQDKAIYHVAFEQAGAVYMHNYIGYEHRADPDLIAIIEEFGSTANGRFAELKVVEIPDGIDWEIQEYDGVEHIAETHQTWS
jgi:hypothetical protein